MLQTVTRPTRSTGSDRFAHRSIKSTRARTWERFFDVDSLAGREMQNEGGCPKSGNRHLTDLTKQPHGPVLV